GRVAVLDDLADVQTRLAVDRPLDFGQADDDGSFVLEELGAVIADVAEALDHHALAAEPGLEPERAHVLGDGAGLPNPEHHAAAGRFLAAADAALGDRLAGDAAERVELFGGEGGVGVGDPGHFPRSGAVVGCGHVHAWADEILADQLVGVAPGDALELGVGVVLAL